MSCIGPVACQLGGLDEESPLPEDTGPECFCGCESDLSQSLEVLVRGCL